MAMSPLPAPLLGTPLRREVDGRDDDLLTAGLGAAGLRAPPPAPADPLAPTATELRRRAIYQAYRGSLDLSAEGGFGRLYAAGIEQRIAGVEYLCAVATPDGRGRSTVCVQIPSHFDPARPLLLALAASGSRGVYGALPHAAEWGLRRGAAVVYTDKGAGNGIWDVSRGRGVLIDGRLSEDASDPLQMLVPEAGPALATLAANAPHALLVRHAHSGLNIEARWGLFLLQAIDVALELLSAERGRGRRFTADNTRIVAAGVSNGGAAVLRAMEADGGAVIDAAVVSEPNAVVGSRTAALDLVSGRQHYRAEGFGLYDYSNLHYLLQPAAVLAEDDPSAPFAAQTAAMQQKLELWVRELQAHDVLPAGSVAAAARAARSRLLQAGMHESGLVLGHFNVAAGLWPSLIVTYAAAYAGLKAWEQPFGIGFAAVDAEGLPRAASDAEAALWWADGNGVPPTAGLFPVALDAGGVRRASPQGSLALALAFAPERLLAGARGLTPPAERAGFLARIGAGQAAAAMSADIGDRPVVMLHGRADGLIPVNHSSRAYFAVNQSLRGASALRYYEVAHGQHFDAYLGLPGFAERYVPLQPWIGTSLDRIEACFDGGAALPPSQVLRSKPRAALAAGLEPLAARHLGELREAPGEDRIEFREHTLYVPD
jgi:hydroxybutyrate-dimer hydrolase